MKTHGGMRFHRRNPRVYAGRVPLDRGLRSGTADGGQAWVRAGGGRGLAGGWTAAEFQ